MPYQNSLFLLASEIVETIWMLSYRLFMNKALIYSAIAFAGFIADACPPGKYLVSAHPRSAYVTTAGTSYSATHVTAYCRSKSKAADYWANYISNGRPDNWPNSKEVFRTWAKQDIEMVLDALSLVPELLWRPVQFYRAGKSIYKGNSASRFMGSVVLYDGAVADRKKLGRIIAHELAHEMYDGFSSVDQTGYKIIAGWKTVRVGAEIKDQAMDRHFVARDGDQSPDEDFANNMEYFIFEPVRLRLASPKIFNWFEKEYGDKIKNREAK